MFDYEESFELIQDSRFESYQKYDSDDRPLYNDWSDYLYEERFEAFYSEE